MTVREHKIIRIIYPMLFSIIAFLLAIILKAYLHRTIALLFFLSVLFSAWTSGVWGGLLATIIGAFAVDYVFLAPKGYLIIANYESAFIILAFGIVSLLMSRIVEKVKMAEDRLKYALETASDGFWDWNLITNEVYYSPRWISSLGYVPEDIPPNLDSWSRVVHPDDYPICLEALQAHFEGRTKIYQLENRLRTKLGTYRWNLVRGRVVEWNKSGKPLRMVGVDIDITDRKQNELDRVARVKAETANRIKDEFIALISHDLRNPLATIVSTTELLQAEKHNIDSVERAAQTISRSAQLQMMLVNDLLDWSRLKSGKFALVPEPTELTDIMETAWQTVKFNAEYKHIKREIEIDPKVNKIMTDPKRLTQVLWNLLTNAVKFTPAEGVIAIRVIPIDDGIQISVKDSGRGISSSDLSMLFTRYWQAQAHDSTEHGGLGLGLSIVKEIIERQGGTIHAESDGIGKGSTFVITLRRCLIPVTSAPVKRKLNTYNEPSNAQKPAEL